MSPYIFCRERGSNVSQVSRRSWKGKEKPTGSFTPYDAQSITLVIGVIPSNVLVINPGEPSCGFFVGKREDTCHMCQRWMVWSIEHAK